MTSSAESSNTCYYTPLYKNEHNWERNNPMETMLTRRRHPYVFYLTCNKLWKNTLKKLKIISREGKATKSKLKIDHNLFQMLECTSVVKCVILFLVLCPLYIKMWIESIVCKTSYHFMAKSLAANKSNLSLSHCFNLNITDNLHQQKLKMYF